MQQLPSGHTWLTSKSKLSILIYNYICNHISQKSKEFIPRNLNFIICQISTTGKQKKLTDKLKKDYSFHLLNKPRTVRIQLTGSLISPGFLTSSPITLMATMPTCKWRLKRIAVPQYLFISKKLSKSCFKT